MKKRTARGPNLLTRKTRDFNAKTLVNNITLLILYDVK